MRFCSQWHNVKSAVYLVIRLEILDSFWIITKYGVNWKKTNKRNQTGD